MAPIWVMSGAEMTPYCAHLILQCKPSESQQGLRSVGLPVGRKPGGFQKALYIFLKTIRLHSDEGGYAGQHSLDPRVHSRAG
jgi:hypothetical protein